MNEAEIDAIHADAVELAKALITARLCSDWDALAELLRSIRTDLLRDLDLPEFVYAELERRVMRVEVLVGAMVTTVAYGLIDSFRRAGHVVHTEALASIYKNSVALDADQ